MNTKYRACQFTDTDKVIALLREVLPDDQPHNEPGSVLRRKHQVDDLAFVATIGDSVCGFVMAGFDGHRGWLYQLAVDPGKRRSGIGKGLVRYAIARLGELGCEKVNLQVRTGNVAAEAFYESLGFKKEQRTSMGMLLTPKFS